ncbi:MAG: HD domain-containing protein [Candidatus Heimdallarchaeota archaeon]|nr:HD domain-containing protein [Candidatus Heimdallarchaeota archaeon]
MIEINRKEVANEVQKILEEQEYKKAKEMWEFLRANGDIEGAIRAGNRLAVSYLGYNDHGLDHVAIVCRNVLQILDTVKEEITPAIIRQEIGDIDDVALVCIAASYLHDVGHTLHRESHEITSALMAKDLIMDKLKKIYSDTNKRFDILSHIQHAIYASDEEIQCVTPEAGFVTIADGLDMCEGRSRKPYDMGKVDIHSISALSIKNVEIEPGSNDKPLRINIMMLSAAGAFQVEEIFLPKLRTSGLEEITEINTLVKGKPLALSQVLKMYAKYEE